MSLQKLKANTLSYPLRHCDLHTIVALEMFLKNIFKSIQEIYKFRYVTVAYVTTNLKSRYRRSVLGFFWTVLAPMLHYIIMGLVFTLLLHSKIDNYFVYYFSGAIFFSIVSATISRAPFAFIQNEHFIKKIYLPKVIFIQNVVIYEVINFLLASSSLIILGMAFGYLKLSFMTLFALIPILLVSIFLFGICSAVSLATVYFRDLIHIVPAILQAAFFATPIIYNKDMIPEKYYIFVYLNPFYYYLEAFREPLLYNRLPGFQLMGYLVLSSIVSFLLGYFLISKFDNKIVFKL